MQNVKISEIAFNSETINGRKLILVSKHAEDACFYNYVVRTFYCILTLKKLFEKNIFLGVQNAKISEIA